MDNYKKGGFRGDDRSGYKGGFKGGNRRDDRDSRGPLTMHSAICSSCGKPCEVPFRPTGEKPVYCRDCFAGRSAMGGDRSQRKDPRTFSQPTVGNSEMKKQLDAMNVKIDKLISIVQEVILKGALKEVTNESKDISTPKVFAKKVASKVKKVVNKK